MIHFICALKCESSAIIDYYDLKHLSKSQLFSIYVNKDNSVSLTISGIGKLASASATAYTYTLLECKENEVWINLGIAGHSSRKLGELIIANRVEDSGSEQVWYPSLIIDTQIPSLGLKTLDKASFDYTNDMFDMEAAGFYSTASRFSSLELAQSIKVISDNKDSPAKNISAKNIENMMAEKIESISNLTSKLSVLASELMPMLDISEDLNKIIKQWHFTQYQKNTLSKTIYRHRLLFPDVEPISCLNDSNRNAKEVLNVLQKKLDDAPFYLSTSNV
jgi:adenosylhomocysteine nucleosidase